MVSSDDVDVEGGLITVSISNNDELFTFAVFSVEDFWGFWSTIWKSASWDGWEGFWVKEAGG